MLPILYIMVYFTKGHQVAVGVGVVKVEELGIPVSSTARVERVVLVSIESMLTTKEVSI